jgi:uncharacterized BrkB/YihY/UPF0761 family membrane protein
VRVPALKAAGIIELGERLIRNYSEHRMATYAAALAYRGLFALLPFMLILVVLVGALGSPTPSTGFSRRPERNRPSRFRSNSGRLSSRARSRYNRLKR